MKLPCITEAGCVLIDVGDAQYLHFEPGEAIFIEKAKKIIARSPTSYESDTERNVCLLSPANRHGFNGLICFEEGLFQSLMTSKFVL